MHAYLLTRVHSKLQHSFFLAELTRVKLRFFYSGFITRFYCLVVKSLAFFLLGHLHQVTASCLSSFLHATLLAISRCLWLLRTLVFNVYGYPSPLGLGTFLASFMIGCYHLCFSSAFPDALLPFFIRFLLDYVLARSWIGC